MPLVTLVTAPLARPCTGSARPLRARWRHHLCGLLLPWLLWGSPVRAQDAPPPGFDELERAGATIGEIRIAPQDIFDLSDPKEDKLLFRLANALHSQTRPEVVRRALLFKTGDPVSVRVIEETERLLRSNRYLYDVQLRPLAVRDGVVDVEVVTRDTWSLNAGASVGRSGGQNSSGVKIEEYNLLGTGTAISIGWSRNVDRSGTEFGLSMDRVFGSRAALGLSHARNSDGQRSAVSVVRPFYALDARWTAGVTASNDDRIDSVYDAGVMASQYRHRQTQGEVFAGWSPGLVDGWVHRYTVGLTLAEDTYAAEPGLVAPATLPGSLKQFGPFVRYELLEDRYDRAQNRNLVGRPEFFSLGLNASVQLGWASTGLGSSRDALLYSASLSRGFEPVADHLLTAAATLGGTEGRRGDRSWLLGLSTRYYRPLSPHWLFYASAAGDWASADSVQAPLLLGGDNGLRGYPLRFQSGTRRVLLTAEQRFYTDWYPWRLFRVGGAAFVDAGRAWGGLAANTGHDGWLTDVGFGLRIVSVRAAFSNVLHIDLALPLNSNGSVTKTQLLVKSKNSF